MEMKKLDLVTLVFTLSCNWTLGQICFRAFKPSSHFNRIHGYCGYPLGGTNREFGTFVRSRNSCCRRAQANAWGVSYSCRACQEVRGWPSAWSQWTTCSRSCGLGMQTRRRTCSTTVCPGMRGRNAFETRRCSWSPCCPIDGGWTNWSPSTGCSVTCGTGMEFRIRSCSNPIAKCGGKSCEGMGRQFKECFGGDCAEWSAWAVQGPCSASCGEGTITRLRECHRIAGGVCPGPWQDQVPCFEKSCEEQQFWCSWGGWSGCSATCRKTVGMRKRTRVCSCGSDGVLVEAPTSPNVTTSCSGEAEDFKNCTSPEICASEDNWSAWGPWSRCTAIPCLTSNKGIQLRSRTCNSPSVNKGVTKCLGDPFMNRRCLNIHQCFVEGVYSMWGEWSQCSKTCGNCGMKKRTRRCVSPYEDIAVWGVDVIVGAPILTCYGSSKKEVAPCFLSSCEDGADSCGNETIVLQLPPEKYDIHRIFNFNYSNDKITSTQTVPSNTSRNDPENFNYTFEYSQQSSMESLTQANVISSYSTEPTQFQAHDYSNTLEASSTIPTHASMIEKVMISAKQSTSPVNNLTKKENALTTVKNKHDVLNYMGESFSMGKFATSLPVSSPKEERFESSHFIVERSTSTKTLNSDALEPNLSSEIEEHQINQTTKNDNRNFTGSSTVSSVSRSDALAPFLQQSTRVDNSKLQITTFPTKLKTTNPLALAKQTIASPSALQAKDATVFTSQSTKDLHSDPSLSFSEAKESHAANETQSLQKEVHYKFQTSSAIHLYSGSLDLSHNLKRNNTVTSKNFPRHYLPTEPLSFKDETSSAKNLVKLLTTDKSNGSINDYKKTNLQNIAARQSSSKINIRNDIKSTQVSLQYSSSLSSEATSTKLESRSLASHRDASRAPESIAAEDLRSASTPTYAASLETSNINHRIASKHSRDSTNVEEPQAVMLEQTTQNEPHELFTTGALSSAAIKRNNIPRKDVSVSMATANSQRRRNATLPNGQVETNKNLDFTRSWLHLSDESTVDSSATNNPKFEGTSTMKTDDYLLQTLKQDFDFHKHSSVPPYVENERAIKTSTISSKSKALYVTRITVETFEIFPLQTSINSSYSSTDVVYDDLRKELVGGNKDFLKNVSIKLVANSTRNEIHYRPHDYLSQDKTLNVKSLFKKIHFITQKCDTHIDRNASKDLLQDNQTMFKTVKKERTSRPNFVKDNVTKSPFNDVAKNLTSHSFTPLNNSPIGRKTSVESSGNEQQRQLQEASVTTKGNSLSHQTSLDNIDKNVINEDQLISINERNFVSPKSDYNSEDGLLSQIAAFPSSHDYTGKHNLNITSYTSLPSSKNFQSSHLDDIDKHILNHIGISYNNGQLESSGYQDTAEHMKNEEYSYNYDYYPDEDYHEEGERTDVDSTEEEDKEDSSYAGDALENNCMNLPGWEMTPKLTKCCIVLDQNVSSVGFDKDEYDECLRLQFKSLYKISQDFDVEIISFRSSRSKCICADNKKVLHSVCCGRSFCRQWSHETNVQVKFSFTEYHSHLEQQL